MLLSFRAQAMMTTVLPMKFLHVFHLTLGILLVLNSVTSAVEVVNNLLQDAPASRNTSPETPVRKQDQSSSQTPSREQRQSASVSVSSNYSRKDLVKTDGSDQKKHVLTQYSVYKPQYKTGQRGDNTPVHKVLSQLDRPLPHSHQGNEFFNQTRQFSECKGNTRCLLMKVINFKLTSSNKTNRSSDWHNSTTYEYDFAAGTMRTFHNDTGNEEVKSSAKTSLILPFWKSEKVYFKITALLKNLPFARFRSLLPTELYHKIRAFIQGDVQQMKNSKSLNKLSQFAGNLSTSVLLNLHSKLNVFHKPSHNKQPETPLSTYLIPVNTPEIQYSSGEGFDDNSLNIQNVIFSRSTTVAPIDPIPPTNRLNYRVNQVSQSEKRQRVKRGTWLSLSTKAPSLQIQSDLITTQATALSAPLNETASPEIPRENSFPPKKEASFIDSKVPNVNLTQRYRKLIRVVADSRLHRMQSKSSRVKPDLTPETSTAFSALSSEDYNTELNSAFVSNSTFISIVREFNDSGSAIPFYETAQNETSLDNEYESVSDKDVVYDNIDKPMISFDDDAEDKNDTASSSAPHIDPQTAPEHADPTKTTAEDAALRNKTSRLPASNSDYNGLLAEEHVGANPEDDMEPEPEPESEVIPLDINGCGEGGCYAEPGPEWELAKQTWRAAWEVHVYGCGIIFGVLALNSLASIIRLWKKKNLLSQGYFISLNLMLLLLCTTRACYLLIDAYNSNNTLHPATAYFLASIGFPCITSAFSILFLALLKTTKMQLLSPNIQKPQLLCAIIFCHVALSVTTDLVVGFLYTARVLVLVCQVVSIIWGVVLFLAYIYIFRYLYMAARKRQKEMARLSSSMNKINAEYGSSSNPPRLMLNLAIKVTFATALLGFTAACIHVYGMVGVVNVFSEDVPKPWPWWCMNFGLRLTEIAMCVTMGYVATQPLRYSHGSSLKEKEPCGKDSSCAKNLYLTSCHRLCLFGTHEPDESFHQLAMSGHRGSLQHAGTSMGYSNENLDAEECGYHVTHTPELGKRLNEPDEGPFHREVICLRTRIDMDNSNGGNVDKRPRSMLVNDSGFYRFRNEGDPEGDPIASSTDDVLNDRTCSTNENESTFTKAGGIEADQSCASNSKHSGRVLVYGKHSMSVPNTGTTTPVTPRSFCSTDMEGMSGVFTFRPPSSIHLRESIEGALDYPDFALKSPEHFGTPKSGSLPSMPDDSYRELNQYYNCKLSESDMPVNCFLANGRDVYTPDDFSTCHSDTPSGSYTDKLRRSSSMSSPDLVHVSTYATHDFSRKNSVSGNEMNHYLLMRNNSIYCGNAESLNSLKYDIGVEV